MTFFSILFALIAEQYKPVEKDHWIRRLSAAWLDFVVKSIDSGSERSGSSRERRKKAEKKQKRNLNKLFLFLLQTVHFHRFGQ